MRNLQHPDVSAAERTGYARGRTQETAFRCDGCGKEIYVGEGCFDVCGERLCRRCMERRFWREAAP